MPSHSAHPPEQDLASLLRTGIRAARAGQQYRARDLLRRVVASDPENARAWLWLSRVEPELEDRDRCRARVRALDPGDETSEQGLAEPGWRLPDDPDRRGIEERAGANPDRAEGLGVVSVELDTHPLVDSLWSSSATQELEARHSQMGRGLAVEPTRESSREGQALKQLKVGARLVTDGIAAVREGDTALAEALFRRATEEDPENLDGWLRLSEVASSQADKEAYLDRVLRLDAGNVQARERLAQLRSARADQLVQSAAAAVCAGDGDRSRSLLAEAVALNPTSPAAWLRLSEAMPGTETRRDCLRRVLALDPGNEEAQSAWAQLEAQWTASGPGSPPSHAIIPPRAMGESVRGPRRLSVVAARQARSLTIAGAVLVAIGLLSAGSLLDDYAKSRVVSFAQAAPATLREAVAAWRGSLVLPSSDGTTGAATSGEAGRAGLAVFSLASPSPAATIPAAAAAEPTWRPDPTMPAVTLPSPTRERPLMGTPSSTATAPSTQKAASILSPEPTETQAPPAPAPVATSVLTPSRIVIPSVGIDGPVVPASLELIVGSEVPEYAFAVPESPRAGWHDTSASLGIPGNTVINGHNWPENGIFRELYQVKVGALIVLYCGEQAFAYQVSDTIIVEDAGQPVEVQQANAMRLMPTKDERVTIITCHPYGGTRDRLIVTALPVPRNEAEGELPGGASRS